MKRLSIITATLFCITTVSWAQQKHHTHYPSTVYVPTTTEPTIDYKYHDGTAFLTNGSYLKGRFQYNGRKTFIYRASSQATRQRIGFSMIRRMALAGSDTLVMDRTDSTVFERFGNKLYRQLANGSTMVLDRVFAVDEDRGQIGQKLYVLDEASNMYKFTSLQKLNKWFHTFRERSGKQLPDVYLNQSEIVKAVAKLNDE
ncbi:hypothetical protein [Spirosoma endophyticum]|uniref:Uncharacterized protein n=1 Tax=Spirosoma endophyticum TaxID=662367 RepID=A0A1I1IMP9_9BACT|nr:hypothetical protein [Spirosoma endophyticum]SFC37516.1 hypothetical protein SAMN05216167_101979 [Spirosoma endophyticum]